MKHEHMQVGEHPRLLDPASIGFSLLGGTLRKLPGEQKEQLIGVFMKQRPELTKQQSAVIARPVRIISGKKLKTKKIKQQPYILNPYIPAVGPTMMYGPPDAGKTAFSWSLANVMADGVNFLGHATVPGAVLFISLDMTETVCNMRLDTSGFEPKFDFVFPSDDEIINILVDFEKTEFYQLVREYQKDYKLIVIDALKDLGIDSQQKLNDNAIPPMVYKTLTRWLYDKPYLLQHHSNKLTYDSKGQSIFKAEGFNGAGQWKGSCESMLRLWPTGTARPIYFRKRTVCLEKVHRNQFL